MFRKIYEKHLRDTILRDSGRSPEHIALVLMETDILRTSGIRKLGEFIERCEKLGINEISVYIDVLDTNPEVKKEMNLKLTDIMVDMFSGLSLKPKYAIYNDDGILEAKGGNENPSVSILVGFGGKKEITKAVRNLLERVEKG